MSKFIVLLSFFALLTVVSCSSNPSNLPDSSISTNSTSTIPTNSPNMSKNNDSEPVIYFHENPAKDELESISFINSSTILYSFIRGEKLISMEKWAYLVNKDDIIIDSVKYQPTGTYLTGKISNEKVVIYGKEYVRHIK